VFLGSLVTAPASVAYWMESDFTTWGKKLTTICDLRQTHARAAAVVCGEKRMRNGQPSHFHFHCTVGCSGFV